MAFYSSKMADITNGMQKALTDAGIGLLDVNFKDLIDGTINLTRPAANITINSAQFSKITALNHKGTTYKCILDIGVIIVLNQYSGTSKMTGITKEGIYQFLEAVTQVLMIQDVGVTDLQNPLVPKSFRNITSPNYAKAGFQLYLLNFSCAYNFTMTDPDLNALELKEIVAKYFIQPNDPLYENVIAEDDIVINT